MPRKVGRVNWWGLGYLAPAVFVGAMCVGYIAYSWLNPDPDALIPAESGIILTEEDKAQMAAGNNEGLIESKAVIEDVGGEDKTLLETELENEAEKDKTLLEAALDNAPAMHSDNTDLSAMPEIEAKLSNWPAGTFELPIFWGTGREILRPYGLSFAATYGDYRYHGGWDFAVGLHEEVLCSAPGVVVKTDYSEADKYAVLIRHGDGWESSYQQLCEVRVAVDEAVGLGQVIGIIGEPGVQELAEGPHLHWELWHHGARQDPAKLVDATVSGEAQ